MSKEAKEATPRVVVAYESNPLLKSLDFEELLKDYLEAKAELEVADAKVEMLRNSLAVLVQAAGADTVNYTGADGKVWSVLSVAAGSGEKTDPEKLLTAMGLIGKLDSDTIKQIFAAAQVPTSTKAHGKVIPPKEKKERKR